MQPKVDNVHFKKDRKLQYDLIRLNHKIKEAEHMTFGEKLFKLRKEKGLSQEALAEQVGTTRQAISKWENNQGFPETEKLLQGNATGPIWSAESVWLPWMTGHFFMKSGVR